MPESKAESKAVLVEVEPGDDGKPAGHVNVSRFVRNLLGKKGRPVVDFVESFTPDELERLRDVLPAAVALVRALIRGRVDYEALGAVLGAASEVRR